MLAALLVKVVDIHKFLLVIMKFIAMLNNKYQNITGFKNVGSIAGSSNSSTFNNTFAKSFKASNVVAVF
jgi:hypothetical protein